MLDRAGRAWQTWCEGLGIVAQAIRALPSVELEARRGGQTWRGMSAPGRRAWSADIVHRLANSDHTGLQLASILLLSIAYGGVPKIDSLVLKLPPTDLDLFPLAILAGC
jgi:hypothetical protein